MLKKTITYINPMTDQEVTEDHYFHLSNADLIEMEVTVEGGMETYLTAAVKSEDNKRILDAFRLLVRTSYGRKEGDLFVKDPKFTEQFMSSEAWSEFLMSLMEDSDFAAQFVNGIMPRRKLQSAVSNLSEGQTPNTSEPTGLTSKSTPRVLTHADIVAMDSNELKSGLAEGRYKLS